MFGRHKWLQSALKKRVILHLSNDLSIQGSLFEVMPDGVILRAAEYLNPGAGPTAMAGEVHIGRERIVFAQLDE